MAEPGSKRKLKKLAMMLGIAVVVLMISTVYLVHYYGESRPTEEQAGRTHAATIHSRTVYLTNSEYALAFAMHAHHGRGPWTVDWNQLSRRHSRKASFSMTSDELIRASPRKMAPQRRPHSYARRRAQLRRVRRILPDLSFSARIAAADFYRRVVRIGRAPAPPPGVS